MHVVLVFIAFVAIGFTCLYMFARSLVVNTTVAGAAGHTPIQEMPAQQQETPLLPIEDTTSNPSTSNSTQDDHTLKGVPELTGEEANTNTRIFHIEEYDAILKLHVTF